MAFNIRTIFLTVLLVFVVQQVPTAAVVKTGDVLRMNMLACIDALADLKDVEVVVNELKKVLEALLGNLVTLVLSMADCASDPRDVFEMMQCFVTVLETSGPDTEVFLHAFYNLTASSQYVYQEISGDVRKCVGDKTSLTQLLQQLSSHQRN